MLLLSRFFKTVPSPHSKAGKTEQAHKTAKAAGSIPSHVAVVASRLVLSLAFSV